MVETYIKTLAVFALIFVGIAYFWTRHRKNMWGPVAMFETRWGVDFIEKVANISKRFWKVYFTIGVVAGFFFMVNIFIMIFANAMFIAKTPTAQEGIMLAIPGITIPFLAPLIAIIILVLVHELSHGIISHADGVKVQSVGALMLGFLPVGAFVKPDEKKIKRLTLLKKLRIFAAGSFTNIVLSFIVLLFLAFVFLPGLTEPINGVMLTSIEPDTPAEIAGLEEGMLLTYVGEQRTTDLVEFRNALDALGINPGDPVKLTADGRQMTVGTIERDGRAYIGIGLCGQVSEKSLVQMFFLFGPAIFIKSGLISPDCYPTIISPAVFWFVFEVLKWTVILNYAVGLINLLPIKPLDGGLMAEAVIEKFSRKKRTRRILVYVISLFCLAMLLINILGPAMWRIL